MCDFKPGDEVVCVATDPYAPRLTFEGSVYRVQDVVLVNGLPGLILAGLPTCGGLPNGRPWRGHNPHRFRKVERKTDKLSLTEWLSQPAGDTDRIDRSAPIAPRKRERA